MKRETLRILAGVPLSDYPKPPEDQPGAFEMACPECGQKMWFTPKKLKHQKDFEKEGHDYKIVCWNCIKDEVQEMKDRNEKMPLIGRVDI